MKITPNRKALKLVADLSIDSNFVQQYGNQVFSYNGDETPEYKTLCENLALAVSDALTDLQNIQKEIPTINSK